MNAIGYRMSEPLMYFGNHFKGEGEIQFSFFRSDFSTSNPQLIESFEVAAIRSGEKVISNKVINALPYFAYSFDEAKQKQITKDGEYIMGAYGFLSPDEFPDADKKFPLIKIQQPRDSIEAYKNIPLVYLVIVKVQ